MKINLRTSSISLMLEFMHNLQTGQTNEAQLASIFNHPDYDFEFRRYQAHEPVASKEEITDYFLNLRTVQIADIPALRLSRLTELQDKHPLWLDVYENPKKYEAKYNHMLSLITDDVLCEASSLVKYGLPDGAEIGEIDFIVTLSIGGSCGYVYDGAFHIDLMQMEKLGWENLKSIIAHEVHHVALMNYEADYVDTFSLEEWFIHFFAGEGLAVKFCNNAQGTVSKPIYKNHPVNEGLDRFTMEYLNRKFDEAYTVFNTTLEAVRHGKMTRDELWKHLMKYWFCFHTDDQSPDEAPKLLHSLAYSFGNDFYGAIYDAFGKEILFECVKHPIKAVDLFERAKTNVKTGKNG